MKQERLLIEMSEEKQLELCNAVYLMGCSHELDGETYTSVDKINTSKYTHDGRESWDYIVQRKSDGLYFKFNVWDSRNGWVFKDKGLEQVFQTTKTIITYE